MAYLSPGALPVWGPSARGRDRSRKGPAKATHKATPRCCKRSRTERRDHSNANQVCARRGHEIYLPTLKQPHPPAVRCGALCGRWANPPIGAQARPQGPKQRRADAICALSLFSTPTAAQTAPVEGDELHALTHRTTNAEDSPHAANVASDWWLAVAPVGKVSTHPLSTGGRRVPRWIRTNASPPGSFGHNQPGT